MKNCRIIIVEDNEISALNIEEFLLSNSYKVDDSVSNYYDALDSIKLYKPNLLICDINLNDKYDGCDIAKFAKDTYNIPTIFISAKHSKDIIDKINLSQGLAFLSKPYNQIELQVVLKMACHKIEKSNHQSSPLNSTLNIGKFDYYKKIRKLYIEDQEVNMGSKQLQVLDILACTPNIVVSHNYIVEYLWEVNNSENMDKLRQIIKRLRTILGEDSISLIRNIGYSLNCD